MALLRSSCSPRSRSARRLASFGALAGALALARPAVAQDQPPPPPPTGAPPKEAEAIVAAPKDSADVPKIEKKLDGTAASVSAGSLLTTGNSRLFAASGNGIFETRFSNNGVGASLVGNYGQGAPAGSAIQVTTANLQGRLRYDRYFADELAGFLINTGRYDRFQGLDFRYNLDPGVKYLFIPEVDRALWAELGYDFQYDVRRNEDRVVLDANKNPVIDPVTGAPQLLPKTATDHSIRAFVGHKHAFNKEVTLALGVEYLQSVVESTRYRVNGDALIAAKIGGGLALGVGFSARFDHAPLPGKEKLDTSTTLSLIYAFSDTPEPPAKPTCPCEDVVPPPPPPPTVPTPPPTPTVPTPPPPPGSPDASSAPPPKENP
jgi:putative salt-induced outer membrane protein